MVSIILPIYNAEKTVRETIDSIYAQTYQDWELLLINDQSTDDTQNIIDTYKHTENGSKRVPIYLNTRDIDKKGLIAALNYGLSKATGDFIARMDADDRMRPERLEIQEGYLRQNPTLNLVSSDMFVFGDSIKKEMYISSMDSLNDLDIACYIAHPTVMWRKSYFEKYNLVYNEKYTHAEDYELWFKFRQTPEPTYYHINKVLYDYRVHKDQVSNAHSLEQKNSGKQILKDYNIPPYISVVDLNNNYEELDKNLSSQKFFNYEIISSPKEAKGKIIAFSKYDNIYNRLDVQVNFLRANKDFVGVGSYIQKKEGTFFYTPEPRLIEKELLRGHTVIEPGTFMCRNIQKVFSKLDKNIDFFQLYCNLLKYGKLTNLQRPLVYCDDYKVITNNDLTNKIKYAKEKYKDIINVVHLNITSDGNFSGVDRYITTLENNLPENFRVTRITFIASNKIEWKINQKHILIYYNPSQTKLESMYDMFWDNLNSYFLYKPNLIVQSNCLNLYTLVNFLRKRVRLTHVCCMHCVPYREVIRFDKNKYAELETLFEDETQDFIDTPEHQLPLMLADYVILNTKDAEQYYNRCGFLTPYTVIHNGIESINNGYKKEKSNTFKFIFVGHSSPLKGFDQLLSVIEEVDKKHKIEILWAGAADQQLTDIIKSKNLPVTIFGVIPPVQLNQLYLQADAALIASACETCSYAAIEALSAGLPIIATKAHGVQEIVENVGILIDIDKKGILNKDQYIAAMEKVITDEEERKQMSNKSKNRYKTYSADKMVAKTVEFYKSIV